MKKLIFFIVIIAISCMAIFYLKPITFKFLTGTARILEKDYSYQLKIDNKSFNNCIYKSNESFDKKTHYNFLILYLKNLNIKTDFEIIVININEKIIGYTCSSLHCYDEILGHLIQSDMGSFYTIINDSYKGPGFNTNLKIENNKIDFFIPSKTDKKIHIQILKKLSK